MTNDPVYGVCACHSGVGFYTTDADVLAHGATVIPADRVAPEVRTEGQAWLLLTVAK
jgi:hypothetical protein